MYRRFAAAAARLPFPAGRGGPILDRPAGRCGPRGPVAPVPPTPRAAVTHAPPAPPGAAPAAGGPGPNHPGPGGGEFAKLAAGRRDVDLTAVALEIAADHDPGCDFATVDAWLDARAREVRGRVAGADDDRAVLEALADVLCGEHGLCGGDAVFGDPASSFLHEVIETGTGLPIALSLVYLDVARRVGVPLRGVSSPHHFLCRLDPAGGDVSPGGNTAPALFCDPYHGGAVLEEDEAVEFLMSRCDLAPAEIADSLRPAPPRAVAVRFLNNLKAAFVRAGDWRGAWPVQHRLAALCPADYRERRDLALVALHADKPGQALDLLDALLPLAPDEERETLREHRDRAVADLAKWN